MMSRYIRFSVVSNAISELEDIIEDNIPSAKIAHVYTKTQLIDWLLDTEERLSDVIHSLSWAKTVEIKDRGE